MKVLWLHIIYICVSASILQGQNIIDMNTLSSAILIPEEDINTPSFEFSPVFYGPFVAFVYDKGNPKYYDEDKNTPYFDMAFSAKNTIGNLAKKASFDLTLSSDNQEGPYAFYDDDTKVIFTRATREDGRLRLFISEKQEDAWTPGTLINILPESFHTCHPTVSPDGRMMIFSAAEESYGTGMDLYVARRTGDLWKNIVRLDSSINSSKNDWFPRFINDTVAVYASERLDGYGGLDMYAIKYSNGRWSAPEHIPEPINSSSDDFGLIVDEGIAYFSSNRPGGKGQDDLYRIEFKGDFLYDPSNEIHTFSVTAMNKLSLEPIPEVTIEVIPLVLSLDNVNLDEYNINLQSDEAGGDVLLQLTPKNSLPVDTRRSNDEGVAMLQGKAGKKYIIKLEHPDFQTIHFLYSQEEYGDEVSMVMDPHERVSSAVEENKMFIPTKKGSIIVFENIYYDFNSHVIKQGASIELDALAQTMIDNPFMKVQLNAHTDARGTKLYNQKLSEKRARSAMNYLISKGVDPTRIVTVGYGEDQLRNQCEDGVQCNDAEHSYNRRTEVIILDN